MKLVYLDNASTTPMLKEVVEVMSNSMCENYANPSSIHQLGRKAKTSIEVVRKKIAKYFNVCSDEIIFTSNGTESNNFILNNAVKVLGVKRIVTSRIEHYAVLKTIENLKINNNIKVDYVNLDELGLVNLEHLKKLLASTSCKTMVSLMMVNNELGNLLPIKEVSSLCKKYNSLFHSDTVQSIGQYHLDLKNTPIDFFTASAHKFHGPKGVGFAYFKKEHLKAPFIFGGGQEKGLISGTENVHSIIGMGKALEVAIDNMKKDFNYNIGLKKYFIDEIIKINDKIKFNGASFDFEKSSPKILNLRFPFTNKMLLFNFDLLGLLVSSGSACKSGALKVSHVLKNILSDKDIEKSSIRISFSKLNTKEDVNLAISIIKKNQG